MHRIVAVLLLVFPFGSGAGQDSSAGIGSFRQLRFSPDGQYVLAQDDSEVTVLSVEPFTILFRIPAQNATDAQFTPDSRSVVFVSSAARVDSQKIALAKSAGQVERWSVADHTRVASTMLPTLVCGTEELSPDGGVLACLDLESTLCFVDVGSGQTVFEKKKFARMFEVYDPWTFVPKISWGDPGSAHIDFSPDGRFVLVRPHANGSPLAWNVPKRSIVELTGPLKQLRSYWSAFVSPDRIVMSYKGDLRRGVADATVIAFPSGKLLSKPRIPFGLFFRATDPGFVIIRPFGEHIQFMGRSESKRVAAAELSTGLVIISETPALDVFGRLYVAEREKGEVALYEIGKGIRANFTLRQRP